MLITLRMQSRSEMTSQHDAAVLNAIFNANFHSQQDNDEESFPKKDHDGDITPVYVKEMEKNGILKAEKGEFDEALSILTKVIEITPSGASGYNNRAQVYRLIGEKEAAIADLNQAIKLSGGCGRPARQAFCQRGIIFWRDGDIEQAKKDFKAAADLGNSHAKSFLVQINPYAALCNQMFQAVFNNLYT